MLNNDFSQPIEPAFSQKKATRGTSDFFIFIYSIMLLHYYVAFYISTASQINYKDDILLYAGCQSLYLQVFLSCSGQMRTGIFYETHSLKAD